MAGHVLQGVCTRLSPARAAGPWAFLPPTPGMLELTMADDELIGSLAQDFSLEELENSRVLVRKSNGALSLHPVLQNQAKRLLVVREEKNALPFDLVNQKGSLLTDDPPAFASCRDLYTRQRTNDEKQILVAFSADDLTILRLLDLPCTPSAGLLQINGRQICRLFRRLNRRRNRPANQSSLAEVAAKHYKLVLMGCQLSKPCNELPHDLKLLISRLVKMEDAYGHETDNEVEIWRPDAGEFERIIAAAEFQDRPLANCLIRESLSYSTFSVRECHKMILAEYPLDYPTARRELLDIISQSYDTGFHLRTLTEAADAFQRAFEQNVTDAMIRDAVSAADALERSQLLLTAELMERFHKSSPLLRATERAMFDKCPPVVEPMQPTEFKEALQIIESLVKVSQQLRNRSRRN